MTGRLPVVSSASQLTHTVGKDERQLKFLRHSTQRHQLLNTSFREDLVTKHVGGAVTDSELHIDLVRFFFVI
eukprot:1190130-Amphidinium_carterae.1